MLHINMNIKKTPITTNSHFINEANENDVRTMLSQFDDLVWEVRCETK